MVAAVIVTAVEIVFGMSIHPVKLYEFRPNHEQLLDALFETENAYQAKCRLSKGETLKLLARMGYQDPRLNDGRHKYCPLHRFIIYLMCMARHKAFEDIAFGIPALPIPSAVQLLTAVRCAQMLGMPSILWSQTSTIGRL